MGGRGNHGEKEQQNFVITPNALKMTVLSALAFKKFCTLETFYSSFKSKVKLFVKSSLFSLP
jgi:hypothetical protein